MFTNLKTSTSASDAECESGTTTDVRVVALAQQLHDARHLPRVLEQQERKRSDSCSPDIIRRVGDGDVQELADGVVVRGTSVSESKSVDTTVAEKGVLWRIKVSDE